jgi:hypothetical protein
MERSEIRGTALDSGLRRNDEQVHLGSASLLDAPQARRHSAQALLPKQFDRKGA